MLIKELLRSLDLGNSVAEFDSELESYFVETDTFRAIVLGEIDVIAGDKGTGKTAIYRVLRQRYRTIKDLEGIEILPAFNPAGNPIFQRLAQIPPLEEGQYVSLWKSYFLSLVGNWLLEIFGPASEALERLDSILTVTGLRSSDDSANTIFSKLVNLAARLLNPKSAQIDISISEAGMPVVSPKVEFETKEKTPAKPGVIPHEEALGVLNACLAELGVTVWVALDRLDEAFQGYPAIERPALRALLRTYLDLLEFDRLKLKLFVRRDLFRKVVEGGFVNLTHVNAKRRDIIWDEDDLRALLCRRIRGNGQFVEALKAQTFSDQELFAAVFPKQVDVGQRKPTAWSWIMRRISDGNGIKPPRNLIDLAKKSQEAQQRAEERLAREHIIGAPVIEADAIRKALQRLSDDRTNDTLLAEAAELAPAIEMFRGGKAEQNVPSLAALLAIPENEVKAAIKPLIELGFLEDFGETFKVPILYRDGLQITQGKAFAPDAPVDEEE